EDAAIVTSPSLEDGEKESEVSHMPSMSSYVNVTLNDSCGERLIAPLVSELSAHGEKQLIRSSGRVYHRNPLAIQPVGLGADTSALTYAVQENKIVEAFNPASALPSFHLHTVDIGDTD